MFRQVGGWVVPAVLLLAGCEKEAKVVAPPPLAEVKVSEVVQRDVPIYVEAIGETRGNTEIEIRARVEGFIESVDFKEGSLIEKGAPLYTIDPQPFQAKLAQAKGSLAQSEADLARAHQDVVRYEPLVAKNAISRQDYETAVALEKAAQAAVEAQKAVVSQAEIDLSYTKVTAPDAGLVGKTEVYAGTLVGRGQSTLLTRISRTDPIHVRFSFPERDYLAVAKKRGYGVRSDEQKEEIPFEMVLPDGSLHGSPGTLVFVDRNVDATTGTIMAEAEFANPGQILRPGQYVRVRANVEKLTGAILVPQRAVREQQGVTSVMVLGPDDVVEQRIVTAAERLGTLWVIRSGLKGGEKVVVDGLQKIRPKDKVKAQVVPAEEAEPPADQPPAEKPAGDKPPGEQPASNEKTAPK